MEIQSKYAYLSIDRGHVKIVLSKDLKRTWWCDEYLRDVTITWDNILMNLKADSLSVHEIRESFTIHKNGFKDYTTVDGNPVPVTTKKILWYKMLRVIPGFYIKKETTPYELLTTKQFTINYE